ncbi:MAG: translation elongation factor 4 [Planctomycetota bacterium]|nr:translation elongation factor 4 [Planctomycetota bacterium]
MTRGPIEHIRNFAIVAHIDHGKSTLADRFLEITGLIEKRTGKADLVLDDLEVERERGITIKARAVRMPFTKDGKEYVLNLIDTPGHVDFTYEVSRSLAACEGAILLVDATQGVEAQTVANAYLAVDANLEILPALNKIDMQGARPEEVREEIENVLGLDTAGILHCSAKTGEGARELLGRVIDCIPAPVGDVDAPLRALLFDAVFDVYRGVIIYVRLIDGVLNLGDSIHLIGSDKDYEASELGVLIPHRVKVNSLSAGESGYLVANIKSLADITIGDTVTHVATQRVVKPLPGYRKPQPMVYCGLYPTYPKDFEALRKALQTLSLNDASFTFHPETSEALGFGFRCGFLGLLHMEIVQERLEDDSDVDLVQTAPNVTYEVVKTDGTVVRVEKPSDVPEPNHVEEFREPIARCSMILPHDSVGSLMQLATEKRGVYIETQYLSPTRVMLIYDIPLQEIVFDFYDKLKSATRGYGTLDYDIRKYERADLVRLRILVNGVEVDALSMICHRETADRRGRRVLARLRQSIPKHLFKVPLQAAVGGKIIARETINALRKDVTAKCYGGDITRKRKLLEKQKAGKKRMKQVGNVEIPQEAFLSVLSSSDEDDKRKRK